jgi:hypothetical protein
VTAPLARGEGGGVDHEWIGVVQGRDEGAL